MIVAPAVNAWKDVITQVLVFCTMHPIYPLYY